MLTVKELMTRGVFTLPPSCLLESAAWALVRRGIGAAPVQADDGRIVGVVSKSDLLQPESAREGGDGVPPLTVADVMTPALVAMDEGGSLAEAVRLMADHGVHRIFVLREDTVLVGVVTALDVLRRLVVRADENRLVDDAEWPLAPQAFP